MSRAVVLLHSSGSSSRQWAGLASSLGPRYEAHTVDFHGHGLQPAWPGARPLSLADDAALVAARLRETGPALVVGHSYGGAVALKVAELHPEAVHGVVVYEPPLFGWLLEDDPHSAAWREVQAVISAIDGFLERGDPASAARGFVDYWSGEGAWDRLSVPAQGAMAGRMPAIRAHFEALRGEALAALRARRRPPIVFLGGSESPESTRRVAEIARVAFAEATFEVLPGMGHMGPMTHAGAVFPRIERALYGISRPRFRISSHSASTPTLPSLVWRQVERTRRVPSRTEGE